jgi:hypothetical protein
MERSDRAEPGLFACRQGDDKTPSIIARGCRSVD